MQAEPPYYLFFRKYFSLSERFPLIDVAGIQLYNRLTVAPRHEAQGRKMQPVEFRTK